MDLQPVDTYMLTLHTFIYTRPAYDVLSLHQLYVICLMHLLLFIGFEQPFKQQVL